MSGDLQGSVNDFTKAIDLDPEGNYNYDHRGMARYLLRDYDRAEADIATATELRRDMYDI